MNKAALLKLLDMGLLALSVGLERQAILDRVKAMQAQGSSAEQIADALKGMRDEAIAKARAAIGD